MSENESKPETVHVRIAVAIDSDGVWGAAGRGGETDEVLMEEASSGARDDTYYFVEAEIPIPRRPTVAGTVTPAESEG